MHDYINCKDIDCPECQALIDEDIIMACDICDSIGLKESEGWHLVNITHDGDGGYIGEVACDGCYQKYKPKKINVDTLTLNVLNIAAVYGRRNDMR